MKFKRMYGFDKKMFDIDFLCCGKAEQCIITYDKNSLNNMN